MLLYAVHTEKLINISAAGQEAWISLCKPVMCQSLWVSVQIQEIFMSFQWVDKRINNSRCGEPKVPNTATNSSFVHIFKFNGHFHKFYTLWATKGWLSCLRTLQQSRPVTKPVNLWLMKGCLITGLQLILLSRCLSVRNVWFLDGFGYFCFSKVYVAMQNAESYYLA